MTLKRILLVILTFVPLLFFSCAQGPYNGPMSGWGHMMGYGYGGGFMWIIIIILIAVVIYFLVQTSKSSDSTGSATETPLDILKKRYAEGEIDKEEFDRIKKDLES